MWEPNRKSASILRTALILVTASVIFIGGVILLADIKCSYDIENWWAPPYPNGETVEIQYDLFRPRALGITTWIMVTDDDEETVKQFYRDKRLEILDQERLRGMAYSESSVFPRDDGQPGGKIVLYSACGT